MDERLAALLSAGAFDEALRYGQQLLAQRRLQEGIAAHVALAQAAPALRGRCFGIIGDAHAELGETQQARLAYEEAARAGIDPRWVQARIARLYPCSADVYVSGGGREAHVTSSQEGIVVARPHYVAFVPTAAQLTLFSIAGRVAVSAATGAVWARLPRGASREQLIVALRSTSVPDLDAVIPELAQSGVTWTPNDAWLERKKLPLGTRLAFTNGREKLHVVPSKEALSSAAFANIMRSWRLVT